MARRRGRERPAAPSRAAAAGILTVLKGINLSFGILRVALRERRSDPRGIPMHSNELKTGYRRYHETVLLRRKEEPGITYEPGIETNGERGIKMTAGNKRRHGTAE